MIGGNLTGSREPTPAPGVPVSRPTDVEEQQAERVARSVPSSVAASHASAAAPADGGSGRPLPSAVGRAYGGWLGADLSGVRLHSGPAAERSAAALGAAAYTQRSHITLGPGATANGGLPQPSLLAHELAHVVQGGPRDVVRRQPLGGSTSTSTQSTSVGGPTFPPNPLMTPVTPIPPYSCPQMTVQVPVPRLGTATGPDVVEYVSLTNPVLRQRRDDLYVVPDADVFATPEEARAHAPGAPFTPATGPIVTPPPAGPLGPSRFAGARTVYALDGALDVVAASGGYIVTTTFTKYAVGAGSTTLVRTAAGWALVDAGMHQVAGSINELIADALVERIVADLAGQPLVEVMLTHIHLDHTALLPRLYARLAIGTLRVNALQALLPSASGTGSQLDDLVRQMIAARRDHIRAEVRGQLTGTFTPPAGLTDPGQRQAAFDAEVERLTLQRMQAIQSTTVELAVPSGGQVTAVPVPLGQISIPSPADPNPQPITQGDLSRGTLTLLDPSAGRVTNRTQATGQPPSGGGVDRQSSTYAITLPDSGLLLVLADQRVEDVLRLQRSFESQLHRLGVTESFRLWDMTHHSQAGFVSGTAVVRSRQLSALTQMLSDFIDSRAAQGSRAGDALIVSVHGGAGGESYVDPSHLWLLGSLGYKVYPATGGGTGTTAAQDISVLQVVLGGGRSVSGIAAPAWAAGSPQDPVLRKAGAAVAELRQQESTLTAQRQVATDDAQRQTLLDQARSAAQARQAIEAARTAYIAAVRAEIGRSHRDPATAGRPDVAPPLGAAEPAAAQLATLRSLLAGFTAPVVGEPPRFTSAALVVVGRSQLAAQDEPTRRLLAARARVQELAAGLRWSASPARRNQVAAALDAYRAQLQSYLTGAPAGTREVLTTELGHVDADIHRLTGLTPVEYAEAQRAAALADEVARQTAGAATLTFEELSDNTRAQRVIQENNGFALVEGRLYRLTVQGGGVRVSAVPLLPASVPRTPAPPPPVIGPPAPTALPPAGGLATTTTPSTPPRQPIFVPGPIPAEFLAHPNVINISGRTVVLEGGPTMAPTPSQPVEALRPGELFVRGYTSQWVVSDPATGRPVAVARTGGEVWQVESGGRLTLLVDAHGNVQAERGVSVIARPGALPTGGGRVPTPETTTGGPGAGTRIVAGGLGLFVVVNEILTPIARVLNQQRYNIALSEAQYRFWVQFGANPTWEMRTQNTRETQPSTAAPDTSVFGQPVYRYITDLDVAGLSAHLDAEIRDYQDLTLWLDAAHQIQAIETTPRMEPSMTAAQRALPRTHQAWVAGEPGQRRGRMVDLTAVIQRQETRVLAALDVEMRARLAALPTEARRQVHRLKHGSETRVYRLAESGWVHGSEPILSASSILGPDPWVRVLAHKAGRARVEAVNADARRSALVSAYQIDKEIDDVLKEVTGGGRPVTSKQERYGSLESFVAGPKPGDTRFGVTRYYRHQQQPHIWTVAIGQLNEFWVDDDDLQLVDEATVTASLTAGSPAPAR